jgi:hypothetical protein
MNRFAFLANTVERKRGRRATKCMYGAQRQRRNVDRGVINEKLVEEIRKEVAVV